MVQASSADIRNDASTEDNLHVPGATLGDAPPFVALVSGMSADTFQELITASPRRIRETLFGRLGIKAKKRSVGIQVHGKLEERTRKLHERLRLGRTKQENDLCEELLRNWLFTKRSMLKAALDHLGVPNDNGLIEQEPSFFQELDADQVRKLWDDLCASFPAEHVRLYLAFVKTPHLPAA